MIVRGIPSKIQRRHEFMPPFPFRGDSARPGSSGIEKQGVSCYYHRISEQGAMLYAAVYDP